MPAYAALGTPDSIQSTFRCIFRLFLLNVLPLGHRRPAGYLAQPADLSRTSINGKKNPRAPQAFAVTPALWRVAVAVVEWRQE